MEAKIFHTIAARLLQALDEGKTIPSLEHSVPSLTVEEAYSAQFVLRELKLRRGEKPIGWKVGATNPKVMAQIGVSEPILGHLTSASRYPSGTKVIAWKRLIRPGIEPEMAFRLKKDLPLSGITTESVAQATELVFPAVEIIDSRIEGWGGRIIDMIADNVLHKGIVLGERGFPLEEIDLAAEKVSVEINGKMIAEGLGANVLQSPMNVVIWLAQKLSELGHSLKAGDLIMTGSLTPFFLVNQNDQIKISYGRLGTLEFSFR